MMGNPWGLDPAPKIIDDEMSDLVEQARLEAKLLRDDIHGAFDHTATIIEKQADEIERLNSMPLMVQMVLDDMRKWSKKSPANFINEATLHAYEKERKK